jgi:cytochrome c biogenesis protein CcdA/thiol-disulfide isomerase/thioredoxin
MLLLFLAFLGGTLTILSPCVVPVIPFVFAQANRPFRTSGLPTLVGMAVTFAAVASAAAIGGGWVVRANQVGRTLALVLLAAFGVTLVFPAVADALTRPLVRIGGRLQQRADASSGVGGALLLGVAVGFLWAPCAGPVLGLILTSAALGGASIRTTALLFAFAAGAATSLGLAIAAGSRVFATMKRSLGAEEWIRRALGVLVLAGVAAVALGLDTGLLARLSLASTTPAEQKLVDRFAGRPSAQMLSGSAAGTPTAGGAAGADNAAASGRRIPDLMLASGWINSPPLTSTALHGHVVLLDVWTYSCINCLRTLPYVRAWAEHYASDGLVVIGVHSPEFAFERDPANVARAVRDLDVRYPVALDNDYGIWRALDNQYWPAEYLIDTRGHIRYQNSGEGHDAETEQQIRKLLAESGHPDVLTGPMADISAGGAEAAAAMASDLSPETYVGYRRAQRFASPEPVVRDSAAPYTAPATLAQNAWGLGGRWTVGTEAATLDSAPGRVVFRFHARDVHLVLGPGPSGRPVRFRVRLDGEAPMEDHGTDISPAGDGTVTSQRLYQLLRQHGPIRDRTIEIEFLDPGVAAYAFTFG